VLGCLISLSTLIPTLLVYGNLSSEMISSNVKFNFSNLTSVFTIIWDFINYSVYNLEEFSPSNSIKKFEIREVLMNNFWIIPIILFLISIRCFQIYYLIIGFWKNKNIANWKSIQYFVLFTIVIIWFSFMFTEQKPKIHKYYLIMPVSVWYSLHIYEDIYKKIKFRKIFILTIMTSVLFYFSMMIIYYRIGHSLYSKRDIIENAIKEKDYTLVTVRRETKVLKLFQENLWVNYKNGDTLIYYNNMEPKNKYNLPQNIISKKSHSGNYSCKLDSIQPFSIGLFENKPISKKVKISFWVNSKIHTKTSLILSLDSSNKNIFWEGKDISSLVKSNFNWQYVVCEFQFPIKYFYDISNKLGLYFLLNKPDETVFVDDIKIQFIK
jgi:hypothetical protein